MNNGFNAAAYNAASFSDDGRSTVSATPAIEYGHDPASSSILNINPKNKDEDLKAMLEGTKDNLKLEAMKRIIRNVAKGRDYSHLFANVVKNVVSKDMEVKKLVYVYLNRYAEEQQDLALLSISSFQKSLRDPNQLIRASALRMLSSIRVPMIVPILMLSIRQCSGDLSAYVKKTVAHAIPKLYYLDPDLKDQLIEVIERLLTDPTTLVAGSAIQAFEEVCPERLDLIHKHYRKLCNLLLDVEEWGQVVIVNMLTRYARSQFRDPNRALPRLSNGSKNLIVVPDSASNPATETESSEESDGEAAGCEENEEDEREQLARKDWKLLADSCRALLVSRNAAVVLAASQFLFHCGCKTGMGGVARAMLRLLQRGRETQHVVLCNIATMSLGHRSLFEPHLKSFFVFTSDPLPVKLYKLEILCNLASDATSSAILREFQAYVTAADEAFVSATIQSIGRVAAALPQIAETCLSGLVRLVSRPNENVVAESVVVIRKLLQIHTSDHREIITQLAGLLDTTTLASAKSSILWLVGEYCTRIPRIAPDVLRKMAKSFPNEDVSVKLQVINLATKLCITNPRQTHLLAQYVFNLAKYDLNYDIRDRSRFIRALLFPSAAGNQMEVDGKLQAGCLARHAKKIFLATKPAPILVSAFKDRDEFRIGSLSHFLNRRVAGYTDLPGWPSELPNPHTREVAPVQPSAFLTSDSHVNSPIHGQLMQSSGVHALQSSSEETASETESEADEGGSKCNSLKNSYDQMSNDTEQSDSEPDSRSPAKSALPTSQLGEHFPDHFQESSTDSD